MLNYNKNGSKDNKFGCLTLAKNGSKDNKFGCLTLTKMILKITNLVIEFIALNIFKIIITI
ncbi:hypothetical protein CN478_27030 [Bacillus cereus]|nr:hypothetical protein CN478_27030 [Bacillus cereus]PFZ18404.1 hypothetical protein COL73_19475 [Bacillus thuringiensis]